MAFVEAGADRGAPATKTIEVAKGIVLSGIADSCESMIISAMPQAALIAETAIVSNCLMRENPWISVHHNRWKIIQDKQQDESAVREPASSWKWNSSTAPTFSIQLSKNQGTMAMLPQFALTRVIAYLLR